MTEYPNPGVRIGAFGVQGRFSGEFLLSALFSGELAGPRVLIASQVPIFRCNYPPQKPSKSTARKSLVRGAVTAKFPLA